MREYYSHLNAISKNLLTGHLTILSVSDTTLCRTIDERRFVRYLQGRARGKVAVLFRNISEGAEKNRESFSDNSWFLTQMLTRYLSKQVHSVATMPTYPTQTPTELSYIASWGISKTLRSTLQQQEKCVFQSKETTLHLHTVTTLTTSRQLMDTSRKNWG
jgi:hypothetical protein